MKIFFPNCPTVRRVRDSAGAKVGGFQEGDAGRHSREATSPWKKTATGEMERRRLSARGTAVDDRMMMMMPAGRVCAAPLCSDSPIGRLLHCGASEQSVYCRCCARAVVERPIALLLRLSLSLSLGWRRLLLSAAWESEARDFPATAYSRCSCCGLRSWPSCGKENGLGEVRAGSGLRQGLCARMRVCASVGVCVHACAQYRASLCRFPQPPCSHVIFQSNRRFAVLQPN